MRYIILFFITFFLVFFGNTNLSLAGSGHNISGWAWSDAVGWISFNSENCDVDDNGFVDLACGGCDSDPNNEYDVGNNDGDDVDRTATTGINCAAPNTTPVIDYATGGWGVDVDDATGVASGYAWSEVEGWIRFDPPGAFPDLPNNSVQFDETTNQFSGWARICSRAGNPDACDDITAPITQPLGNGWVRLTDETPPLDHSTTLGKDSMMKGYAYSDDIGWISFSSDNCDPDRDGRSEGVGACPVIDTDMADYGVGKESNVTGYAWTATYGWISMNCRNTPSSGNCGHHYGVHIDPETYNMGGFAWSANAGWISFGTTTTPDPVAINNECINTCTDTYDQNDGDDGMDNDFCSACFDPVDNEFYGWAKVLSLDYHDGWIRLDDNFAPAPPPYQVSISAGELIGFAWGGSGKCNGGTSPGQSCAINGDCLGGGTCEPSGGVGWVSFNCNNYDSCNGGDNHGKYCLIAADCPGGGSCVDTCIAFSNYSTKVDINVPPTIASMTAPNWGSDYACQANDEHPSGTGNAKRARLDWTINDIGDSQSAYRVRVCRNSFSPDSFGPNCSGGNFILDTTKTVSPNTYHEIALDLSYNTQYSWGLIVWDSMDLPSNSGNFLEFQPFTIGGTHQVIDGIPVAGQDRWQTWAHEFPRPEFEWFPHNPSAYEEVQFTATSTVCYPDCSSYIWSWEEIPGSSIWSTDSPSPDDSYSASTTIIKFTQPSLDIGVELEVHDGSNYSCSTSTGSDTIKARLPDWKEGR
jgi:hypothetical protein